MKEQFEFMNDLTVAELGFDINSELKQKDYDNSDEDNSDDDDDDIKDVSRVIEDIREHVKRPPGK